MAAIDVNVAGTRTVLDAAAASDRVRRMVFVSSAGVYGDGSPEETHLQDLLTMRQLLEAVHGGIPPRFHEGHTLRPVSVCGNTKVWGKEQTRVVLGEVGVSLYTEEKMTSGGGAASGALWPPGFVHAASRGDRARFAATVLPRLVSLGACGSLFPRTWTNPWLARSSGNYATADTR
ncbi:hypothetical protein B6R96_00180 [Streptomyces sp. Sge12]|nr:hypothetical protein B6R96_00180 [Streptomyces sp. Sge12]